PPDPEPLADLCRAALKDKDLVVRVEAVYALTLSDRADAKMAASVFVAGLKHPRLAIRLQSLQGLAHLRGSDEAALAVLPLLRDPDADVQAAAVDALRTNLGPFDEMIAAFGRMLNAEKGPHRVMWVELLARYGPPALPELMKTFERPDDKLSALV